jgi:hypothetical protein
MITKHEARKLIEEIACGRPEWLPIEDELIIFDQATIERSWGWVFFFGSKLWNETQDIHYAIAGNAPLLVERDTGKIIRLGTHANAEHFIERYELTGDPFK